MVSDIRDCVKSNMPAWVKTSIALCDLEKLLTCTICNCLVNDPCSLEACDHFFCRLCAQKIVGNDSKCPECGAFSWVKDLKTNRQLANTVALFMTMQSAVNHSSHTLDPPTCAQGLGKREFDGNIWENTEQMSDGMTDTYMFPSSLEETKSTTVTNTVLKESTPENDKHSVVRNKEKNKAGSKFTKTSSILNYLTLKCKDGPEERDYGTNTMYDPLVISEERSSSKDGNQKLESTSEVAISRSRRVTKCESFTVIKPNQIQIMNNEKKSQSRGECDGMTPNKTRTTTKRKLADGLTSKQQVSPQSQDERQTMRTPRAGKRLRTNSQARSEQPVTPISTPKSSKHVVSKVGQTPRTPAGRCNVGVSPLIKKNKRGETLLHIAVIKGNTEDVRRLLYEGADPNTRDNARWTPLHEACNHGHVIIAELLLDHGALIDTPGGFDHDTPLHDAVTNNQLEVVKLLVSRGAPLNIRNKQGLLPYDYARTDAMQSILKESCKKNNTVGQLTHTLPQVSSEGPKVLLSTGLSTSEKDILQKCAIKLGGEVVDEFSTKVTHIITCANENRVCARTLKYLSGVLCGKWIVTFDWISKSIRCGDWENEEQFEVKGTADAQLGTPRIARINAIKCVPGLFEGCSFYVHGTYDPAVPSKEEITQLIKYGGGKVLSREPRADDLEPSIMGKDTNTPFPTVAYHARPNSNQYWCTNYIIFDPLCEKQPKHIFSRHVSTAPFTWLLDCISHYQILDVEK